MKEIKIKGIKESIFQAKLNNGLNVYFYSTDKTKNFYISITIKYGAKVEEYKINNQRKYTKVLQGSAHFLEHEVMGLDNNKEKLKLLEKLGSHANAWTNYEATNYNVTGSIDILKNLNILLDIVFYPKFSEESINIEKNTINEEIDMSKDDILTYMYEEIYKNLFNNLYFKNNILGNKEDIKKINYKHLIKIYKDFYNTNNMFIVIVGNFNKEEVFNFLNNYFKDVKHKKNKIKIKKKKELDKVSISYEEVKKNSRIPKIFYGIKMPISNFKINKYKLNYYLFILFHYMFSSNSLIYDKYKNNELIVNMDQEINMLEKHIVVLIKAYTKKPDKFIKTLQKDLRNINIDKESFERKKKLLISSLIINFENIMDIEAYIVFENILKHNKIISNEYDIVRNLSYKEIKEIEKNLIFNYYSILKVIK